VCVRHFRYSSIEEGIYPFNRRLSFGVFVLQRQGLNQKQIAARMEMDIDHVDHILSVSRVRDGIVKKKVEKINPSVLRLVLS
jgi:hypothetical protein